MSIFYRDGLAQEIIARPIGPEIVNSLADARSRFAPSYLNRATETSQSLASLVHGFSHLIFTYLGFSMELDEVSRAWEPVNARVKVENLRKAILSESPEDRFLKIFDYVEIVSLEAAILARLHRNPKVFPIHISTAFSRYRLYCPFEIEGCD